MADSTLKVIFPEDDEEAQAPGGAAVATQRLDDAAASATLRAGSEATQRVGAMLPNGQRVPLGFLDPGTRLCGDCVVERTLYPHESQRPGLYVCQSPHGRVIVKVYAAHYPPKPELWNQLVYLHHRNVLRVYRTLEEDGYFFEVQEYCAGGTLDDMVPRPGTGFPPVTPEWVMTTMVPQVFDGLKYLHDEGVIHRDIKPANLYFKHEDEKEILVLGDFDISSVLEQHRTSRDTQRAAGTWIYTAPEAFPRFVDDTASGRRGRVTRSCDYYSLGITIIEVLLGTTSLHLCQLPDLFDFYLQGGRVEIPQGIQGRLAILLRGLLIRNRHTRWGADEVARWLAGQTTDADMQRIFDDEAYVLARSSRPYRLGELVAIDLASLADAMSREEEIAKEDLLSGDILLNWVGQIDPEMARNIRRDRERWRQSPDVALMCTITRCDPNRPFIFPDGAEAFTAKEWLAHAIRLARNSQGGLEAVSAAAMLQRFEVWLRYKAGPEPEVADAVAAMQQTPERVRLEELAYHLQPERPFPIMQGAAARAPVEFVRFACGTPEEWKKKRPVCYDAAFQRWFEGGLCAWLRQRGLAPLAAQCDEVREQLADEPFAAFEMILRLLDPELSPITVALDTSEISSLRTVPYGRQRTYTLRYTAHGCGIPFGAIQVRQQAPGVQLRAHLIDQRKGQIEVVIDSRQDLKAFAVYEAVISLESGIARLTPSTVKISYRTVFPLGMAMRRILFGAGIGALVLGLPRLLLCIFAHWQPVSLDDWDTMNLWDSLRNGNWPFIEHLIAFFILGACLYLGLRLWFAALRQSET